MAVVFRAHRVLFLIDACFLRFEVLGFTGSELAAVDALGNAILLIVLALRDRLRLAVVVVAVWSGLLREC